MSLRRQSQGRALPDVRIIPPTTCAAPYTFHIPSIRMENTMTDKVVQLRGRVPDTEKITINLGYVDLGRIDLLVQEGFFSNRTDFIRTAIRNQLNSQSVEVSRSIERHTLELGLRDY